MGLEFNLVPSDLDLPDVCPVLGVSLNYESLEPRASRPSLDRSDNRKGYIKGNVRVISNRANQIKNDASSVELEKVLRYVKMLEEGLG